MAMTSLPPIAQGIPARVDVRTSFASSGVIPLVPATMNRKRSPADQLRANSRGFTLIEMLVSLAITLIMMGAVVTLFGVVSESVSGARSAIEMADRLRGAKEQLQLDLQGVTATMKPPLRPEMDQGYFEIIEGPSKDDGPRFYAVNNSVSSQLELGPPVPPPSSWVLFGDTDDVLMFTTRNRSAPFLGRVKTGGDTMATSDDVTTTTESPVAEVVYFLVQDGPSIDATVINSGGTSIPTRLCTLYRRVLLVSPGIGSIKGDFTTKIKLDNDFYTNNDLSVRYSEPPLPGVATLFPNTLGDLTKRENRFAHYGNPNYQTTSTGHPFLMHFDMIPAVPFKVVPTTIPPPTPTPPPSRDSVTNFPSGRPDSNAFLAPFTGNRLGDDVLLTNVLAFDVTVWDPDAAVRVTATGVVMNPEDPGWSIPPTPPMPPITPITDVAFGAYVDLGYNTGGTTSKFEKINPELYPTPGAPTYAFYDTWSLHYENDGIDQDSDGITDAATNGLDDDTAGVGLGLVDDETERDTLPPYKTPLRGIKVTIRTYEPSSQQVREAVVIQNFATK